MVAFAPVETREYSPPFLTNGLEPGLVQIWTGYIARTIPSWSLLVRPVANLARSQYYDLYEGIVETDTWFGPLFTNIQLKRTDVPIVFSTDIPLVQVQPVRRELYAGSMLDDFEVGAIQRRIVNATSSAPKASPFDHFTFGCSLKRQVFRSSDGSQLAAR